MVRGLPLELPRHHHRPLPVNHRVRGHLHAGGEELSWIVVAQLPLLDIAPEFGRINILELHTKVLLSVHNQGPRFVSHGKVGSAKGD